MNARMVTMEVVLTSVPIPVEATSVHADVAMNFRGKMEHQEVELVMWTRQCTQSLMLDNLALFPGSRAWAGKKRAWYTLFAHAQFSQDFWEFGNSRKICSVTLTSERHADFSRIKDACYRPRSLQTMTRERRRYSALRLQELSTRSSIPAKPCGT